MDNYKRFTCQNGRMYRLSFDRGLSWSPVFIVFSNHLANETENRLTGFENTKLGFFPPTYVRRQDKIKKRCYQMGKMFWGKKYLYLNKGKCKVLHWDKGVNCWSRCLFREESALWPFHSSAVSKRQGRQ